MVTYNVTPLAVRNIVSQVWLEELLIFIDNRLNSITGDGFRYFHVDWYTPVAENPNWMWARAQHLLIEYHVNVENNGHVFVYLKDIPAPNIVEITDDD